MDDALGQSSCEEDSDSELSDEDYSKKRNARKKNNNRDYALTQRAAALK